MIPILGHLAAAGAGACVTVFILLRLLSRPDRPRDEYPLPLWSDRDR